MGKNLNTDWKDESSDQLKARIGDEAYKVTQLGKTEKPFTGKYNNFFEKGLYVDVVSGEPLFSSADKFDGGCGWPSFGSTIEDNSVSYREDMSFGMIRTEVMAKESGSHLGHLFDDGPVEFDGRRYCIDSAALRFIPYDQMDQEGYGEYRKYIR